MSNPIEKIFDFITLGGPVVVLLLILSIISLTICIIKFRQFSIARLEKTAKAEVFLKAIQKGHIDDAKTIAASHKNAILKLLKFALDLKLLKGEQPESLEDHCKIAAQEQLDNLRSGFRALNTIAQIAPLLGLFGTVLGMIEAFQKLQEAGQSVDPSLLAGGIWVALLTTAVGLGVAMPTNIALTYFEGRVARYQSKVEKYMTAILDPLPDEKSE